MYTGCSPCLGVVPLVSRMCRQCRAMMSCNVVKTNKLLFSSMTYISAAHDMTRQIPTVVKCREMLCNVVQCRREMSCNVVKCREMSCTAVGGLSILKN